MQAHLFHHAAIVVTVGKVFLGLAIVYALAVVNSLRPARGDRSGPQSPGDE